jgi:nucleoside-diphosphate-sugar epimerase
VDLSRFLTDFWEEALRNESVVFNIGNPANRITIQGLAERVKTLLDSPSQIVYTDGRAVYGPMYAEAEAFERVPALDNSLKVGWEPSVSLDELILETANYYQAHERSRRDNKEGQGH